jgi:hypothetical protein
MTKILGSVDLILKSNESIKGWDILAAGCKVIAEKVTLLLEIGMYISGREFILLTFYLFVQYMAWTPKNYC